MSPENLNSDQFGRVLGSLDTPSFTVAEKSYLPNLKIPRHHHDEVVMSFPLAGSFVESNSTSRYTCEQYGLSINPAGEGHASYFCRQESRCLVVEVRPHGLSLIGESSKSLDQPLYLRGAASSALGLRVYREIKSADEVSALLAEGLMLEIVALAIRDQLKGGPGAPPRWLLRARDYLHAHFNEHLGLQQLAQVAGVHPAHLSRMFRRHYRRAVGEYVRELRLDASVRELCDPDKTLAEVAAAAGFYDQSHFANAFKRHTGMTPAAFRRTRARARRPTMLRISKTNLPTTG
ncbi:MAG TPA: helix-turn-helix domain-containing protein [Pyrinomonadaceae bacterium]|jgi:AraC family transcriptional regulator|nr:helix-turn-helix domain-containing protein [Pyrinomonadaceae bacterium]